MSIKRCPTGKRRFADPADAANVLRHAADARYQAARTGAKSRRREVRYYLCSSCDGFHLTSRY
jgi:hypothetical protein